MTVWVLGAAALASGLMAGLFFGFSVSVMPGLRGVDDVAFVGVMRAINRAIENGPFALVFLGAGVLPAVGAVLQRDEGGRSFAAAVVASVLYVLVLLITFAVNIPLNRRLDAEGVSRPGAGPARQAFEEAWTRWHTARTLLSGASFGAVLVAVSTR